MSATLVLADDDADLRAVYVPCLRAAGHTVFEAADGRQALALVRAQRPSLLLLDLWMPALNGFEVLEQLRYDPCASGLKVVVLSNMADADSRLESFGAGAVSYFVKGIALSDLMAEIDRILDDEVALDCN
jgi:CheY-like chemotaxis protein